MSLEGIPSIAAIAQRDLGHRSSKALDTLAEELAAGERAAAMLKCRFTGELTDGLLVLTDLRLVFVKRGVLRQHAVSHPLEDVRELVVGGRMPRRLHLEAADGSSSFDTEAGAAEAYAFAAAVMALVAPRTPSPGAADEPVVLADVTGRDWLQVVGERRYQEDIDLLFDPGLVALDGPRPSWAVLLRESEGDLDPHAVRVLISGSLVGHLPREDAERFVTFFDSYPAAFCPAVIRGPRGHRGVVLRVDHDTLADPDTAEVTTFSTLLWG